MSYNHKEYMKEYRQKPEVKARKRKVDAGYRERHKEELKERRKAYDTRYYENNKGFRAKMCARRRSYKLQASPNWGVFNDFIIQEAYHLSQLRKEYTKIDWHVDHIIPLKNKKVCGLHVGTNLQVIPAITNIIKSNKLII